MPVYSEEDNAVAKAFSERPRTVQARKSIPFFSSRELAEVSEGPLEDCGLGMFRSRTGSIWRMDEGKIWREDDDMSWVDDIVTAGDADRPSPPKKLLERYRQFKMAKTAQSRRVPGTLVLLGVLETLDVGGEQSRAYAEEIRTLKWAVKKGTPEACQRAALSVLESLDVPGGSSSAWVDEIRALRGVAFSKTAQSVLPYLSDNAPLEGTPRAAGASSEVPSPTGADNVGTTRRGVSPGGSRKVGEIKEAVTEKGDQVPVRQPYAEGDRVFSISRQIPGKVTKVVNQFVVEVKFEGPEGTFADETLVSDLQPDRTHFASQKPTGSTGTSTDGNHKTAPAVETDRNRVPLGSARPKVG